MTPSECPCKRLNCERHGNCEACRAYHASSHRPRPCEKPPRRNRISRRGGSPQKEK